MPLVHFNIQKSFLAEQMREKKKRDQNPASNSGFSLRHGPTSGKTFCLPGKAVTSLLQAVLLILLNCSSQATVIARYAKLDSDKNKVIHSLQRMHMLNMGPTHL